MGKTRPDLIQGTLDLLVLKALSVEPMHGWGICERIQQWSGEVFELKQGSLYPALARLSREGYIDSGWQTTENNRRARYYHLTAAENELSRRSATIGCGCRPRFTRSWKSPHRSPPMRWIDGVRYRIAALLRPGQMDRDLAEEMRFHLEMEAEKNERMGMSPAAARDAARRQFGGRLRYGEQTREARGAQPLLDLVGDLRLGTRSLRRAPTFTVVAVATLALGIGATAAMFSIVQAVLLRPLPYQQPDRLVQVWEVQPGGSEHNVVSRGNFLDWRERNRAFSDISAYMLDFGYGLTGDGDPVQVAGSLATPSLFTTLGVEAALGRTFLAEEGERGRDDAVLLSDGLWRRRFGADPEVLGRSLTLDGNTFFIVGVMPPEFGFPSKRTDLWMPPLVRAGRSQRPQGPHAARGREAREPRHARYRTARHGAPRRGDRARAARRDDRLGCQRSALKTQLVGDSRPALVILLLAVGLLLLVACANVANLVLARGVDREQEIALRTSLGAPRGRLVRLLVAESLLLAMLGALGAVAVAFLSIRAILLLSPPGIPRLDEAGLDAGVFGFTLLIALASGLLCGVLPALQATRRNLRAPLAAGSRGVLGNAGRERARRFLVIGELALSLVLLVGAGLLGKSFLRLQSVDHGFDPENLTAVSLNLPGTVYGSTPEHVRFFAELIDAIDALPGVASVGATSEPPIVGFDMTRSFDIEGTAYRPRSDRDDIMYRSITPNYLATMGIPVEEGRSFVPLDGPDAPPVLLVNRAFAERYFPAGSAIGRRIAFGRDDGVFHEIIGVVGDTRHRGLDTRTAPAFYAPHSQKTWQWMTWMTLMVRTDVPVEGLDALIRDRIWALDDQLPILFQRPVEELYAESAGRRRFNALLMVLFAATALALGTVGVYGAMSCSAARRRREMGLRLTLGASRHEVTMLILRQGLSLTLIGIVVGSAAALLTSRWLAALLFGVAPTDPMTYLLVATILTLAALAACLAPARRVSRSDPVESLRA